MVLSEIGPNLGRPYVDTVYDSKYSNMKELRVQSRGNTFRIFFAFDPTRSAIVLIGGDKKGVKRFYVNMVKRADELYEAHLRKMEKENEK